MNKKTSFNIIVMVLILLGCTKSGNEYIGTFRTSLPKMINNDDSAPDKIKELSKLMDWTFIVTSDELKIKMGNKDYLKMGYFIDGKCIVGKYLWGKQTIYYPIYFSDKDNAFSWGQQFVRVK